MLIEKFEVELSKRGIPCVWEKGGSYTNTGSSTLICDKYGKPKKFIYIKRKGSLACGEHALIAIRKDDYVVESFHHRGDFDIEIKRIIEINENIITVERTNRFSENQWDNDLDEKFYNVVEVAKQKALSYHCRKPYFIKEEE